MEQLLNIADADEIMPPKTTWFEPKLKEVDYLYTIWNKDFINLLFVFELNLKE